MITIKDLNFSYSKKNIFNNLNLTIPNGFISIVGPNGCGKTTLLKLIGRELDYKQGSIHIEGLSIKEMPLMTYAQTLAFNRQNVTNDYPLSCLDYVLLGRRPYKHQFEDYNDEDLELLHHIMEETQTLLYAEKHLTELSGGELQRVNLAKILLQDTPYILLDESFSAMDIHHAVEALKMLKRTNKQIICVMHDLNLVYQFSDHVIVLKEGELYDDGPTKDTVTEKMIKDVFHIDMSYIDDRGFLMKGATHES